MAGRLRLDALIRVSRKSGREGPEFRSPEQQRAVCQQWAKQNNAQIVAWHEAIDVSGKTMLRPDVDAARQRLHDSLTDGVIIAWLDRFSRAPVAEAMTVHDEITKAGGRVVACDMAGIDARDPAGEMMLTQMLSYNRYQWRKSAERWDMSRRDAIHAGKAIGGAPFGYLFADPSPRPTGRGIVDSRLVPDPIAGPILRELFERKADGGTWLQLARWLDHAAPKPDGRPWARLTVNSIIASRTYLGEVRHGKHTKAGAHEPLVSALLWRRAQNPPGRRTPRGSYLLSGLVRCSGCGTRMRASSGGKRKAAVFVCQADDCPQRYLTVSVAPLDREIVRQLLARVETAGGKTIDDAGFDMASRRVDELTSEVQRLAAVVPSHPAAVAAHQEALNEAEGALIAAEDALQEMAVTRSDDWSVGLRDVWDDLDLEERREVVRATVDCVLVRRASGSGPAGIMADRVLVLFRGEAPAELMDLRTVVRRGWVWGDDPGSLRSALKDAD